MPSAETHLYLVLVKQTPPTYERVVASDIAAAERLAGSGSIVVSVLAANVHASQSLTTPRSR